MAQPPRRLSRRRCSRHPVPVSVAALASIVLSLFPAQSASAEAAPPPAGRGTFATSFEPGNPAPDWQSTPDGGHDSHRTAGVYPDTGAGLPGSAMSAVTGVTASDEILPDHGAARATDGDVNTIWQAASRSPSLSVAFTEPTRIESYAMTSASDWPERDPQSWRLEGSTDGQTWQTVDTESGQRFGQRSQTRIFAVRHAGAYSHYRLAISANQGDGHTQLAELALGGAPSEDAGMTAAIGDGPSSSPTAKTHVGFTGTHALHYAGWQLTDHGRAYDKIYQVSLPVRRDSRLSYKIFPEFTGKDLAYPSTYVAVDLAFSDGTYLSELNATDQNGKGLSPQAQGESKVLHTDQWNAVVADIGRVAVGKTVTRIMVGYDNSSGPGRFVEAGWTTST